MTEYRAYWQQASYSPMREMFRLETNADVTVGANDIFLRYRNGNRRAQRSWPPALINADLESRRSLRPIVESTTQPTLVQLNSERSPPKGGKC